MTVQATALGALRSPNFAFFWSAQVISGFGDKITLFALSFVTWQLTGSALLTGFAVVTSVVPYALFGFFGGAIADAVGHRRAMVGCDVIRVVAIGAIPALLAVQAPLALVYALAFLSSVCGAVFNPARLALVPRLVPEEQLGSSNSLVYASDRTVEIVGTLLAGLLVAALGVLAFYVDAATFAISAVLLLKIAVAEPPARVVSFRGLLSDTAQGLSFIRGVDVLRTNTVFSLIAQLSLPVLNGLTPVLIFREYGLGPEQFGVVEAATAFGAVVAGLLYPALFAGRKKGTLIVFGFAALGLLFTGVAWSPSFEIAVVAFTLIGAANVVSFVPNVTISQEVTPPHLRARVFGARIALVHLTWIPVILVSGALAEGIPVQVILATSGLFTLVVALAGGLFRSIRDVP